MVSALTMTLVGSTIALGCSVGRDTARGSEIGNLAPDFQLDNLDGQSVSLSDFRGKPVLVNFWASWCPPYRSTVREFVKKYGLTFPVLLDITQDVSLEYYVRAIPTTFFIDREGIIREIRIGPFSSVTEIERSLRKIIR